jgi:hypothetical protein
MTNRHFARTLVLFAAVASIAQPLMASTTVGGYVTSNAHWTTSGSPYIVSCVVDVFNGATLTIDAGVVVKFGSGCGIFIESGSSIVASGSSGSRIVFTSLKDDSSGGDTNGDGSSTTPAAGNWDHVYLWGGTGTFDYADFKYGGYGSSNYAYGALAISGSSASATVDHSHFSYNQCSGITVSGSGTVHVSHTELDHNGNGASVLNAYLELKANSNVHDNSDTGVFVNSAGYTGTVTTVNHSDVTNNGNFGVYLQIQLGDPNPSGHNNNIYDNGSNADARQVYAFYQGYPDWSDNYWGSVSVHTCSFNSLLTHMHFGSFISECVPPPAGPTSYFMTTVEEDNCPVTHLLYCASDTVDRSNPSATAIDNSGQ